MTEDAITVSGGILAGMPMPHIPGSLGRPLMDGLLRLCWRHGRDWPEPTKGLAVTCVTCRRTYVARRKRPARSGGNCCWECGHTTPKGPKHPKQWMWVECKHKHTGPISLGPGDIVCVRCGTKTGEDWV